MSGKASMLHQPFNLGFACSWWRPRAGTWSGTPEQLRQGLARTGMNLLDIEAQPPLTLQVPLAAMLSLFGKRPWKYAPLYRAIESFRVRHAVAQQRLDALIELADLTVPTQVPTYAYQDMDAGIAVENYARFGPSLNSAIHCSLADLKRYADRQRQTAEKLDGILTMGTWFRNHLIDRGVTPAHRVHAVGGGVHPAYGVLPMRHVRPAHERTRLLFVGRDFERKGGDWLLDAVQRLNSQGDRLLTVTIAGPARWPLSNPPPAWVHYYPSASAEAILKLFRTHDLFVMPSRFEAYGLVFLEARAAGLPCVGRDEWAMPELIDPGVGGAVWSGTDLNRLAELIHQVLTDDAMHIRCATEAAQFAATHSWTSVGQRISAIVRS